MSRSMVFPAVALAVLDGGVFRDASGERVANNRPLQSFTRWYGFSLTFPGVPIYGGG